MAGATTDRVLIEPDRIRVSIPGQNVRTASLNEFAFDSRFASIGLYDSGVILPGIPSRTASQAGAFSETVNFRDYGTPPIFLMAWRDSKERDELSAPRFTAIDNYDQYPVAKVLRSSAIISNWITSGKQKRAVIYWKALV